MTFFLLLAALAVAGLGGWMSRRWRGFGQAMMALGGVGLIGVVGWQVRQNVASSKPKPSSRYEMAVSYGLANCLLENAGNQDGKVVLLFPQQRTMDAETQRNFQDGFIPALRHTHAKLSLKAVRLDGASGDLSVFKNALAQTPEAFAVISYAGVPAGFETLFPDGKQPGPLFFVFDRDGTTHWLAALKEGRIKAVVVPRPGANAGGEGIAGMPETIFERFCLLATPTNADEVAVGLKN
jgi:hypothetical protein